MRLLLLMLLLLLLLEQTKSHQPLNYSQTFTCYCTFIVVVVAANAVVASNAVVTAFTVTAVTVTIRTNHVQSASQLFSNIDMVLHICCCC